MTSEESILFLGKTAQKLDQLASAFLEVKLRQEEASEKDRKAKEKKPSGKDGKEMDMTLFLEDVDVCCYCGALFQRTNGKWHILEGATFPNDVWYVGLTDRYPNIPRAILTEEAKY